MASPTLWTWVRASFRRWWRTGKPGMLQSMGSQRVRHDWMTELKLTAWYCMHTLHMCIHTCIWGEIIHSKGGQLSEWYCCIFAGLKTELDWEKNGCYSVWKYTILNCTRSFAKFPQGMFCLSIISVSVWLLSSSGPPTIAVKEIFLFSMCRPLTGAPDCVLILACSDYFLEDSYVLRPRCGSPYCQIQCSSPDCLCTKAFMP